MKQVNFIISQIIDQPSLKKLEQIASYKKLLALLPPRYQHGVRFMYNKNNTLFFVLEHPSFKMEFNYKKALLKSLLKELVKKDKSCACIDAEKIEFFVTNKPAREIPKQIDPQNFYDEQASGKFTNCAQEKKLSSLFEEIREIIRQKRDK